MIQLYDYQQEAVQSIYEATWAGFKAPLIEMPTGTGKSLVIAGGIHRTCSEYPAARHMVLTHVKELVQQNSRKLKDLWPSAPMGIYSAGLASRDSMQPIIFGGCASVINTVDLFGHRDFLWIDEAHLVSPTAETTYQTIIKRLREINPELITVGLTATGYRRGIGHLTNGGIFDSVAIDLTTPECWARFIAEGRLVPVHPAHTKNEIKTDGVSISNGDYAENQLQAASDKPTLNKQIAREIVTVAGERNRNCIMVFCAGVDHAEHMADELNAIGMRGRAIHSKMPTTERDARLAAFKSGILNFICCNNVGTTGFDHPPVDMIAMCRATVSVGLWVQMLGRGTRPSPGKTDCLCLDFARNRKALGPIDAPYIPDPKKGNKTGDIPVKICDHCGTYNHISARACVGCGNAFDIKEKLRRTAGDDAIMSTDIPVIETFAVSRTTYVRHERKSDGIPLCRVDYMCGARVFSEYYNFVGARRHFAHEFWRQRVGDDDIPDTNEEAIRQLSKGVAVTPKRIAVWTNKKYPEIMRHEF